MVQDAGGVQVRFAPAPRGHCVHPAQGARGFGAQETERPEGKAPSETGAGLPGSGRLPWVSRGRGEVLGPCEA